MRSVNYLPVRGLLALFLSVPAQTVVGGFGVEAQDLPLLVDPKREGGHRCPYEEPGTFQPDGKSYERDTRLEMQHVYTLIPVYKMHSPTSFSSSVVFMRIFQEHTLMESMLMCALSILAMKVCSKTT